MIEVKYIDHMGTDLSVVNAARVSFGKKSEMIEVDGYLTLKDADIRLINYLATGMQSKDLATWLAQMVNSDSYDTVMEAYQALTEAEPHKSPFGHCFASFHVKAPVFVARQLVKHKFLRWSEVSRRYVDSEPEFYYPQVWRGKSLDKKQGSSKEEVEHLKYFDDLTQSYSRTKVWRAYDHFLLSQVDSLYRDMLEAGVAPEQARMVLPQSMMTEWWWSGSMDAFADMCNLRCKGDAQYESRLVADQIDTMMLDLYPVSWGALRNG
jgi:thymidylate synthase (FAD)